MLAQRKPNTQIYTKPSGHYKPIRSKDEINESIRQAIREAMLEAVRLKRNLK